MTSRVRFLNREEYQQAERRRLDAIRDVGLTEIIFGHLSSWDKARQRHLIGMDIIVPGSIWECWHMFNPFKKEHQHRRIHALNCIEHGCYNPREHILSKKYWIDWSHLRPPLCVKTPNGHNWIVDSVDHNGNDWLVQDVTLGDYTSITCTPAVKVDGYHGQLEMGMFTFDQSSPHANGTTYGEPA